VQKALTEGVPLEKHFVEDLRVDGMNRIVVCLSVPDVSESLVGPPKPLRSAYNSVRQAARALPRVTREREPAEDSLNAAWALRPGASGGLAATGFLPPRCSAKLIDADVRRERFDQVRWNGLRCHEVNVPLGLSARRAFARP
jgi:hypothetical protein